jgi:hypothetical protein
VRLAAGGNNSLHCMSARLRLLGQMSPHPGEGSLGEITPCIEAINVSPVISQC